MLVWPIKIDSMRLSHENPCHLETLGDIIISTFSNEFASLHPLHPTRNLPTWLAICYKELLVIEIYSWYRREWLVLPLLFNALPVRVNLFGRGVRVDVNCPRCGSNPEDIIHVFSSCKHARKVWKLTEVWSKLNSCRGLYFGDVFNRIVDAGRGDDLEGFILTCWSLWIAQNQMIFNDQKQPPEDVLARAVRAGETYRIMPHNHILKSSPLIHISTWQPPVGVLKVNVDAAVFESSDQFGVGIVGRDTNGHIMFAEGRIIKGSFTPHLAELIAVKEGVVKAIKSGWQKWIIDTDALKAIQAIHTHSPFAMEEPVAENIRLFCSSASGNSINHFQGKPIK